MDMNFGLDFGFIYSLCIERHWICTVLKNPVLGKSSHSKHTLVEQASTLYGIEGENAERAQVFQVEKC